MQIDDISNEFIDQCEHERMKAWMQEHGWSTAISLDPADIYEIVQQYGLETSNEHLNQPKE